MRAAFIMMIVIALWIEAPRGSAGTIDYGKMSKAQLVHRLGLPAEIILFRGPDLEIWHYYYTHDDGVSCCYSTSDGAKAAWICTATIPCSTRGAFFHQTGLPISQRFGVTSVRTVRNYGERSYDEYR